MAIKGKLPTEKMPAEYNGETMTRFAEDVYSQLSKVDKKSGKGLESLMSMIGDLNENLDGVQQSLSQGQPNEAAPCPAPEDLECYKVPGFPIVLAWCKPINPVKFPNVGGFQFFADLVHNFTPLDESAEVTFTGTAANTHATVLTVCASTSTKVFKPTGNSNLQFFTYMSAGNSKKITNLTTGATGLTTAWLPASAKNVTTNIAWNDGDEYQISTWVPKNLVGQGPLPFAIFFIRDWIGNPLWDKESVYVKARTYTKKRRSYSFFETASTTGNDGESLDAPIVTAAPVFWNGNIKITWTKGTTIKDWFDELDHYDLYRTEANDTALLTTDNIIWSGKGLLNVYTDIGYDATSSPTGPVQGTTYYYWVVCVNKEGDNGTFSAADPATLDVGGVVTIYDGVEDEAKSFGWGKNWRIYWYDAGDSEGYWVRYRKVVGAGFGLYSIPIYVKHDTSNGTHGSGYYIQTYCFHGLQAKETYEFSVLATNNPLVPDLAGSWVTQEYSMTDSGAPDTPT